MRLSAEGLKDRAKWEEAGYALPKFDREKVTEATKENPFWIHFGAGNIFRAFQANVMQNILNRGEMETGLIVAEGFDYEIIEKMNRPHDDYSILVTLKADGSVEKTVVGSVVESCILDSENEGEYGRLKEIFCRQSLQMVSFTITEKGYSLVNGKGELLPAVAADFAAGPEKPASYIGKVASLLYTRFIFCLHTIAIYALFSAPFFNNGYLLKRREDRLCGRRAVYLTVSLFFIPWISAPYSRSIAMRCP